MNNNIMTDSSMFQEIEDSYSINVYPKRPIVIVKGKNARVWDIDEKEYIDCIAGIGVANIGHANETVNNAIKNQVDQIITCPSIFYNDQRAKFIERLISVTPSKLTRVFLTNSGTESIEAAIKFTRVATGKKEFISANRGFHGRTLGALSATFNPKYKKPFLPLVPGFYHVPFNNIEKLKTTITEDTAGIILELVQGEGGINIIDEEYITQVRELCDQHEIILIIDEVQTGFCRTGKFFASDLFALQPDIMTVAKSIAGGVPMGAILCTDELADKIKIGHHSSTFGGNPLACAAGIASIDFMVQNRLDNEAKEKGAYILRQLQEKVGDLPVVRSIRGIGLMLGIELKRKAKDYIFKLMQEGVLVIAAGSTVIRLLPPLTIPYKDIDIVIEKIFDVLS